MGDETKISWCQHTWNPWRGCAKISRGCDHCYMFTAQQRRQRQLTKGMPDSADKLRILQKWDPNTVQRTTTWRDPLRWQKLAQAAGVVETVFTCSWSDWFHNDADAWRAEAWKIIGETPNLHYQILTKRAERMARHLPEDWGEGYPNVWLGVSVEDKAALWRMDYLRRIAARVRFISAEPLLEDIADALNLEGIHQAIVGGESGPGYRGMDHNWPLRILDKCRANPIELETGQAGTAFFFKQSAAIRTEMGTRLGGREYKEYPLDLRREASRILRGTNSGSLEQLHLLHAASK